MASFLDKLKKGMDADPKIKEVSDPEPEPEEEIEGPEIEEPKAEEPEIPETPELEESPETPDVPEAAEPTETSLTMGPAPKDFEPSEKKTKNKKPKKQKTQKAEEPATTEQPKKIVRVKEEKIPRSPKATGTPATEGGLGGKKSWFEPEGQLAVDVYQTDGHIVIQSAIAGLKPEDLDICIEKDVVSIKGKRDEVVEKQTKNYFYQECYWGRFSREIILPAEVDASRTEAAINNGILTIRIPKIENEKKRKIDVKE